MKAVKMSDSAGRAGRTATQVIGPGAIIAILAAFDLISWDETQTAAVLAVGVPAWAYMQNWLERRLGINFLISRGSD